MSETEFVWDDLPTATKVTKLHEAYVRATGYDAVKTPATERWWYDAAKAKMHPSDVEAVIKQRKKKIETGERFEPCILLRNVCGSDEAITNTMNEAQQIKARARRPKPNKGRDAALRATGRPTGYKDPPAVKVGVPLEKVIAACREAIEKGKTDGNGK